jgi:hypothetical protein
MEEKGAGSRSVTSQENWLNQVKGILTQEGMFSRQTDTVERAIHFEWDEGHILHLGTDRVLTCSFKVDLEDIRTLIAGDTTEDLSEDELCRVAREELRPFLDRYRWKLRQAGFEESIESDHEQYAIVFTKPLTEVTPQEASEILKWCREVLMAT